MIIWAGWGLVAVFISLIAAVIGSGFTLNGPIVGNAAAAGNFVFVKLLGRSKERVPIDPETNEPVVLKHGDSLFYIPVRYRTWIFLVIGIALIAATLFKQ